MDAPEHVVVGLDGSESAEAALRWIAARLPESGSIDVVQARSEPDEPDVVPADVKVAATVHSVRSPADALIGAAKESGAGLIVVGKHGSGRHKSLGSVTRHLLTESPVPVLVVDGTELRGDADSPPVVACIDHGEPAEAVAKWAAAYAAARGLPLVLLHSVAYRPVFPDDSPTEMLGSYLGPEVATEWAAAELLTIAQELRDRYPALELSTHVDHGSPIRAIRHAGEGAEIVVLGKRHGESFMSTVASPRLRRLVARSAFPTVVVPTCSA